MPDYFVRVGRQGLVGRYRPVESLMYRRGGRVVCRTDRGLEIGQILGPCDQTDPVPCDGDVIRPMSVADELLQARLEQRQQAALTACESLLLERGVAAVLVDVEPLFDGRAMYFYFLGPITPELSALTEELAEAYESQAQLRGFAATLAAGCGPDCGSEQAGGCGSTGCANCAVATACRTSGTA